MCSTSAGYLRTNTNRTILGVVYLSELPSQDSLQTLWDNGFGSISPNSIIPSTQGLSVLANVLIANTPQLVVSMVYVSYNGLWTCMLLSREFLGFAQSRHGLRVTNPEGKYQRSTYWLSLPYRFSIPLLGISAAFHWILSQTMFLVEAQVYKPDGTLDPDRDNSISVVGWSALSLIITISLGALLMAGPLLAGFFRYESGTPIVESCSLAISAACHPFERQNEEKALLKYGVSSEGGGEHVGLSSGRVDDLKQGRRYTSRPCLGESAKRLPPFPLGWLRKKRILESLVSGIQLLQFSISTMVAVAVGEGVTTELMFLNSALLSQDWENYLTGIYIFSIVTASLTPLFLLIRKAITCASPIHSGTTVWDALVETILL